MPATVKLPSGILTCPDKRITQMIDIQEQQSAIHMGQRDRLADGLIGLLNTTRQCSSMATQEKKQTITIKFSDEHMDFCIDAIVIHRCSVSEKTRELIKPWLHEDGTPRDFQALRRATAALILQTKGLSQAREFNILMDQKRNISAAAQETIQKKIEDAKALQQKYEQIIQSANANHSLQAQGAENLIGARNLEDSLQSNLQFARFFNTTYRGSKGNRTYYHDASKEKYPGYLYVPHDKRINDKEKNLLRGGEKHVTHRDNNSIVLVPNDSTPFMGRNLRLLAKLPGIIPSIAVSPHCMIARNGGLDLTFIKNPVDIQDFAEVLNALVMMDALRIYCMDLKVENVAWQQNTKRGRQGRTGVASIIDTNDIVTRESAGKQLVCTPEITTLALIKACFKSEKINPCFEEGSLQENSRYFNAWQQYSLALVVMSATTADSALKTYLFVPKVDTMESHWPGQKLYPGALNETSEAMFTTWIKHHIKEEHWENYRELMSNPAQYAERSRANMPYLLDMIKGMQTT